MSTMTTSDFLEHYGVKGMQWGVRRSRAELRGAAKAFKKGNKKADKLEKKVAKRRATTKKQNASAAARQKQINRMKSGKTTTRDVLEIYGNANIYTAGAAIVNRQSYRKQHASDQQRGLDGYKKGVAARNDRTNMKAAAAKRARAGANKAEKILRAEPNVTIYKPIKI